MNLNSLLFGKLVTIGWPWTGSTDYSSGSPVTKNHLGAQIEDPQNPGSNWFTYPLRPAGSRGYLLEKAGLPPVVRTPEQQAIDIEKGYQYKNYQFVSNNYLFGKSFPGFIHIDDNGTVFYVTLTPTSPPDTVYQFTFNFVEAFYFDLTGQGHTPLEFSVVTNSLDLGGNIFTDLYSISKNGRKVLIGSDFSGYCQVAFSGVGAAITGTLTLGRVAADAVYNETNNDVDNLTELVLYQYGISTDTPCCGTFPGCCLSDPQGPISRAAFDALDPASFGQCDSPGTFCDGETFNVVIQFSCSAVDGTLTEDRAYSRHGVFINACYDANGTVLELTVDVDYNVLRTKTVAVTTTGAGPTLSLYHDIHDDDNYDLTLAYKINGTQIETDTFRFQEIFDLESPACGGAGNEDVYQISGIYTFPSGQVRQEDYDYITSTRTTTPTSTSGFMYGAVSVGYPLVRELADLMTQFIPVFPELEGIFDFSDGIGDQGESLEVIPQGERLISSTRRDTSYIATVDGLFIYGSPRTLIDHSTYVQGALSGADASAIEAYLVTRGLDLDNDDFNYSAYGIIYNLKTLTVSLGQIPF